jgi:hypothetical protein
MEWYGKEQEKIRSYLVGIVHKTVGEGYGRNGKEEDKRKLDGIWVQLQLVRSISL